MATATSGRTADFAASMCSADGAISTSAMEGQNHQRSRFKLNATAASSGMA
jgi:hypothetical protein